MQTHDLIVVGAGPAGSTAARVAAVEGLKVLLLEKDRFPGETNVCAGGLDGATLKKLDADAPYIERDIETLLFELDGKPRFEHKLRKKGATILRSKFDKHLANDAVNAGAELQVKVRTEGFEPGSICKVKTTRGIFKAPLVIGADGTYSLIATKSGIREPWKLDDLIPHVVYDVEAPRAEIDKKFGNCMHMSFGNIVGYDGYAWVFPKRDGASVGVGAHYPLKFSLEGALKKYFEGKMPGTVKFKRKGWCLPCKGPIERPYADNVMVVGDSAGHTCPLSGEGIYQALCGGEIAGEVATKAHSGEDYSAGVLGEYGKRFDEKFAQIYKYTLACSRFYGKKTMHMLGFRTLKKHPQFIDQWWEGERITLKKTLGKDIKKGGL